MVQQSLETCGMYNLLIKRENNVAKSLSGILGLIEPEVAKTLEYIKTQFPNFTEHGIQHSLRIINYIYSIMSEDLKQNISDVEIFCFIMAAFFHDMGMTLVDVEDKDNQRTNHHLYAYRPIKHFFEKYMQMLVERRRLEKCIIFVSEAHGRSIEELYNDNDFRKIETIEGQVLRYGLLAILLRIGDLMDLEEQRVCEFNMHMNLEYYNNPVSLVHNRRHLDDITYNYSPSKITVSVLTDDREKYKVWSQWLEYLDEEIMYANTHYLIGENSDFFRNYKLPEVIKCVKPSENAKFAVEEIRFQVDDTGALWDIITKSVYTNEFDYIRELIQNAIDATLLKIYLDDKENIEYQSPRSWHCNDKVMIAYSQKEGTLWVEDHGTGMNENELSNYLFKTANSGYKYMKKREFMFPAIAKFGIGFVACLTKADKIQILTRTQSDNGINAEIESKSTIAFIEKNIQRAWQGTTVILHVKEKYSFNELKDYVFTYFGCPSVEIDLVDVDTLNIYADGSTLLDESECILQIVEHTKQKRNYGINKILPDYKCLMKMMEILSDEAEIDGTISKVRNMLNNSFYETDLLERIKAIVNDTVVNEECMSKIRKEVSSQKKIIDEKFEKYPQFLFPIFRNDIREIVDYKQLILELDDTFNISRIYKDTISNSSRGIIYISSNFVDYNLGIEWRSINAFMFNEGKIVKNIVKVSSDTDDSSLFTSNIISLDEIADADYEMNNRLQEQESEDYYEHIVKGEYDEIDDNYGFSYDVILLKDNDFYEIFDVEGEIIENVIENNDFLREYKFFNNIAVPDRYKGERFVFGKSELYQDGILLEFNPQCIVPIGVGYVIVNLTAESRLELNVSRHELNNNREIISKWNKRVGCVVQKKVAENCIRVLKENNLDFKIEDLLSQNVEGFFEKECLFNMKDILRELLM